MGKQFAPNFVKTSTKQPTSRSRPQAHLQITKTETFSSQQCKSTNMRSLTLNLTPRKFKVKKGSLMMFKAKLNQVRVTTMRRLRSRSLSKKHLKTVSKLQLGGPTWLQLPICLRLRVNRTFWGLKNTICQTVRIQRRCQCGLIALAQTKTSKSSRSSFLPTNRSGNIFWTKGRLSPQAYTKIH